jgi:hypothetical protein
MFVRDEARIPVTFAVACTSLAGLAADGLLLDASQAAYGDGAAGIARVGLSGTWPGLSKLVTIHAGEVAASADGARLPLRWDASGPGSSLFPALDADITLVPDGEHATMLTLTGVYRPPLGMVGAMLDRAILNRVATATIRDFIGRLAQDIEQQNQPRT